MRFRHAMRPFDTHPTSATWGARCGNSARRVLRGGTGSRGLPSRPVSTHHGLRHDLLLAKVAQRISDDEVLHLLQIMLKANGKRGVPQGGVISPVLSNLYLMPTEVPMLGTRGV